MANVGLLVKWRNNGGRGGKNPEVLEGKVRGVPAFVATVRDVRNVAEFINVNLNQYSGHFQDPMKRSMRCLFVKYVL